MGILETISAISAAVGKMFGFAEKVIPSDKIRESNHERLKIRREESEIIKIYDRQYRRIKDHPEIDITTDVRLVCDNLPDDQEAALIELLTSRIKAYRHRHPILFKDWVRANPK